MNSQRTLPRVCVRPEARLERVVTLAPSPATHENGDVLNQKFNPYYLGNLIILNLIVFHLRLIAREFFGFWCPHVDLQLRVIIFLLLEGD